MKKLVFLCLLVLMGCSQTSNITSYSKDSNIISSYESFDSSISSEIKTESGSSLSSSKNVGSSKSSNESSNISSNRISSNNSSKTSYNPDGSKTLPKPIHTVSTWGQQETLYSFKESFPEEFSYIYGHQIVKNPDFYSDGSWKISFPNSSARKGFQTPIFNTDLKIEIRLYIADIHKTNNTVDEKTPFITIYGFDETGKLIRTKEVENPSKFTNFANNKNPFQIYLSGENISYLELRFTAAPYESSKCYNFGINQIGFKTFPYPIESE